MYVLDSDHLSILQRQHGDEFKHLSQRCASISADLFFVTIISLHEQFNGWLKYIARAKNSASLVRGYTELEIVLDTFSRAQLLPFSAALASLPDCLGDRRANLNPSVRWHPPDKVLDASDIYLTLRNLRI